MSASMMSRRTQGRSRGRRNPAYHRVQVACSHAARTGPPHATHMNSTLPYRPRAARKAARAETEEEEEEEEEEEKDHPSPDIIDDGAAAAAAFVAVVVAWRV